MIIPKYTVHIPHIAIKNRCIGKRFIDNRRRIIGLIVLAKSDSADKSLVIEINRLTPGHDCCFVNAGKGQISLINFGMIRVSDHRKNHASIGGAVIFIIKDIGGIFKFNLGGQALINAGCITQFGS